MSRSGIRTLRSGLVVTALTASLLAVAPAPAAPNQYVTLIDGTSIAVNIRCPGLEGVAPGADGLCPGQPAGGYPTIFEMSATTGARRRGAPSPVNSGTSSATDRTRRSPTTAAS